MKRLLSVLLTVVCTVWLVNCHPTEESLQPKPTAASTLSIDEARLIYTRYKQASGNARQQGDTPTAEPRKDYEKKLIWDYARKETFVDGTEVVLVPLDASVSGYPHVTLALDKKPKKVSSPAEVFTTRKAVIYKREGREHIEYLTVIGEQEYKAKKMYFDEDATFTGAMIFSDEADKMLRGYYYEKGKRLGEVENPDNKPGKGGRKAACYLTQSYVVYTYTVSFAGINYGPFYNFSGASAFTIICDTWSPIAANTYTYNSNAGGNSTGNGQSGWVFNPYAMQ